MSLEDEFQELKNEVRELREDLRKQIRLTLSSAEGSKELLGLTDLLTARIRALETVNRGLVMALRGDETFTKHVRIGAEQRDAVFNGSEITDEQIEEFKARLRDLLPKDLKHLAD